MPEVRVKDADATVLISSAAACKIFGVSRQTLSDWERAGLHKTTRGWWNLEDIIKFRGLGSTPAYSREKSLVERKLEAEVSLKEAQGELSRLKNDIMAGEYLEEYFVVSELKRFFTVFKRSALSLARKVSGQVAAHVAPEVARRMEKEITNTVTDALMQMSVDGVYSAKKGNK